MGLVLAAGAGGWWLANVTLVASSGAEPTVTPVPIDGAVLALQMPDVRGLDLATAQQVLTDSGVPISAITTHDAPSVATVGTVVEQSPAFGATDLGSVDLGLAVPVTMPGLVGSTQDDAVQTLSGYGTSVTIAFGYSKDAAPGTVLSVDPAVGAPLGQTASIVVSTSGSTLPLSQLSARSGRCSSDSNVAIDGQDFTTALSCATATDRALETTWVLSATVDRFTATVGIPDDGAPGTQVPYEVLVDGVPVANGTAAYGASTDIDVPCTGAIQLALRIGPALTSQVSVDFGDAVVYGSEEGIARLSALR